LALYIIAPHDFVSDVGVLINQQKNVSTFTVIMIEVVVAFGIASLALLWNRRLENTVNTRTAELKKSN
jgi:nitrate reductase gamma subunit